MDSTADQIIQNVSTLVSAWGLQLAGALAVLILGRFGCGLARKSVRRAMESRRVDASLIPFISNLVYFTLFAAVLSKDSRVLSDPEPLVAVSELSDSSVNLVVRPWCQRDDYWSLRYDLIRKFKEELEQAGCSIPYPQRDVHLHQVNQTA